MEAQENTGYIVRLHWENMSELSTLVGQAYELSKQGHWDRLLVEWDESPLLARRCSRFQKDGSRWTFLHQAAFFGNEDACRILLRLGAAPNALSHDSHTPADIAKQKGFEYLSVLLRGATVTDVSIWGAPTDPDVLPSSNLWDEASERTAHEVLYVSYASSLVRIGKGRRYFVDALGRVIIGWHGTFDPPCGMDGESIV